MHSWKLTFAPIQRFMEPRPRARCYVLCLSPTGAPGNKGYGAYTLVRKTDKKVFFLSQLYNVSENGVMGKREHGKEG